MVPAGHTLFRLDKYTHDHFDREYMQHFIDLMKRSAEGLDDYFFGTQATPQATPQADPNAHLQEAFAGYSWYKVGLRNGEDGYLPGLEPGKIESKSIMLPITSQGVENFC